MLRTWLRTLYSSLRLPPSVAATEARHDLHDEIAFHLVASVEDRVESGHSPQQATLDALAKFGDVRAVIRECDDISVSRQILCHRVHVFVTAGLLVAVGVLAWRVLPNSAPEWQASALAATGYAVSESGGDIRGTVIGEAGEPVSAAHVLAVVKTWPANGFRQQAYMATTRPDGSFVFENVYPTGHEYELQVSAIADGRLMQSQYVSMTTGILQPLEFRLDVTTPFALRFESPDGTPIKGVRVFPAERIESSGHRHLVYFCSADPIVRESGPSGHVPLTHFLPGEHATVFVRFPDQDWQQRELVIPNDGEVVVLRPGQKDTDG